MFLTASSPGRPGAVETLMADHDWRVAGIGEPGAWEPALQYAVRQMLDSAVPTFIVWGDAGTFLYNDAYVPILGRRHPDALGRPFAAVWPEAYPEVAGAAAQAMAGRTVNFPRTPFIVTRNGQEERAWFSFSYSPLRRLDGTVRGFVCAVTETTDVDACKRSEAALHDARMRLESALGAAQVATWTWNVRENRLYADANLVRLFGVSAADIDGGPVEAYLAAIHPDDVARVQARIEGALATGETFSDSYRVRGADGCWRHVEARGKVSFGADGQAEWLPGVALDVTAQKEAEAGLRSSEARFRVIANAMPQAVWSTRPDGYHDYYNDQWYAFTGMPYGSTDGAGWNALFHPDDQPLAWEKWRHSLRTGEPYEIEYRLRHHTGSYRWVLGRALPVRAEDGAIVRWMGTCTDIHEQKLTQQALQEADRRKDEFLAMLAHELRNPLAPIATAASLLAMAAQDPARVRQVGAVISRQTAHMTGLIDDLMDVSRVTRGLVSLEREDLPLAQVVDDAVEQVRPLLEGRAHRLEVRAAAAGVTVNGDRKRLVQVLANILGNAARYTPAGGHIVLTAGVEDGCALLAVRDNGIGMTPELVASAFELFYQGKRSPDRSQGGLGIGLALVRSLVELHGGSVEAASEGEGRGSTFTVRLPLPEQGDRTAGQAGESALQQAPAALRVLVVDDNTDAAELVAMFLGLLGYEVSVEFSAAAALERARQLMPHVCLLDIGLPGMDGKELARRLRRLPGLEQVRLAAMTGYGQPHDRRETEAAGFDAHFVKPADTDALAAWLAAVETPPA